jgi:hypothetical protein
MVIRGAGEGTRRDMRRVVLLLIVFFIFSFLSLSTASAHVEVRMRVIQALNVGQNIDPSLKELHDELKTLFSFTSYRLLREENLNLSLNQPVSISVHGGKTLLEITLVGEHKNLIELRIRVNREGKDILNTQVRLSPGRTVLVGGPKHGEGVIIYALSARF